MQHRALCIHRRVLRCYLKTDDNSWSLTGGKNGDTSDIHQTRYRYSPTFTKAAVCCVPQCQPHRPLCSKHVDEEQGALVCNIAWPVRTQHVTRKETIFDKETTSYPYTNTVSFNIKTGKPQTFTIKNTEAVMGYKDQIHPLLTRSKIILLSLPGSGTTIL